MNSRSRDELTACTLNLSVRELRQLMVLTTTLATGLLTVITVCLHGDYLLEKIQELQISHDCKLESHTKVSLPVKNIGSKIRRRSR